MDEKQMQSILHGTFSMVLDNFSDTELQELQETILEEKDPAQYSWYEKAEPIYANSRTRMHLHEMTKEAILRYITIRQIEKIVDSLDERELRVVNMAAMMGGPQPGQFGYEKVEPLMVNGKMDEETLKFLSNIAYKKLFPNG